MPTTTATELAQLGGLVTTDSSTSTVTVNGTLAATTITLPNNSVSTASISNSSVTVAKLANPQYTGFRNRIINGDMRIDQRNAGASQSITAASPSYSVDRFIVRPVGGTVTGQRVAGTGSTQYVYQITGGASVTQLQFEQKIEASNSYNLAGSNATLSVNLSNSLLTTANWILYYANATDNFASNTLISSGSWTISSTIARYNATISIPAAATTGLYLIIYVGAQTSGTFKIGDVQLEAGSTATDFERRPYGTELALCQRYFYKTYAPDVAVGTNASVGVILCETLAAGTLTRLKAFNSRLTVSMRATPTVTLYSETGTADRISVYNNDASTLTVSSVSGESTNSLCSYLTTTASATAAQTYMFHATASAEL